MTRVWWAPRGRSYAEADLALEAGLEYCNRYGLDLWRLYLLAYRARSCLDRGNWSEAVETASLVLGDQRSSPMPRIVALSVLGLVRARRGDPGVWPVLDEAWHMAEPTRELQRMEPVAAARAEAAWLEGRPDLVREATEDTLELAVVRGQDWVVSELAFWRWRAGVLEEHPDLVDPFWLQMTGEWGRAAAAWDSLESPYEASLARADADEEEPLRASLDALNELGGVTAARIVARRLRERGARGVPRGPRRCHTSERCGRHGERSGGSRTSLRGPLERRDRGAASPLPQDRRPSRVRDSEQARRPYTRRGEFRVSPPKARAPR